MGQPTLRQVAYLLDVGYALHQIDAFSEEYAENIMEGFEARKELDAQRRVADTEQRAAAAARWHDRMAQLNRLMEEERTDPAEIAHALRQPLPEDASHDMRDAELRTAASFYTNEPVWTPIQLPHPDDHDALAAERIRLQELVFGDWPILGVNQPPRPLTRETLESAVETLTGCLPPKLARVQALSALNHALNTRIWDNISQDEPTSDAPQMDTATTSMYLSNRSGWRWRGSTTS